MESIYAIPSELAFQKPWLLLLLSPLVAFIILIFVKRKWLSNLLTSTSLFIGLVLSMYLYVHLFAFRNASIPMVLQGSSAWVQFSAFHVELSYFLDWKSTNMLVMLYIVAFAVALYSMKYMQHETQYVKYFQYLNLFVVAMVAFILSSNLLLSYIFWEMIGFCSFIFIGFWFQKTAAIKANKKAFYINRFGDMGFLFGIALLYQAFGTFDFREMQLLTYTKTSLLDATALMQVRMAGYCIFIAVMAKSAQFPLHVWLPEAMEGPSPISAMIHAATMVVAGVFLLIRISFLLHSDALMLITVIGLISSFFGALMAARVFDIKKILAYSTISQLGFMLMSIGLKANEPAFYHLITHAFFKAALFLMAGTVIHFTSAYYSRIGSAEDPQDIRNMGSLRLAMPLIAILFCIASAALAGLIPLAAHFSKDAILQATFTMATTEWSWPVLIPVVSLIAVIMSTYYVCRLVYYVFLKTSDANFRKEGVSVLELVPIVLLVTLSIYVVPTADILVDRMVLYLSSSMIFVGFMFAYLQFGLQRFKLASRVNFLNRILDQGFFINHWYDQIIPLFMKAISGFARKFDESVIDGFVNLMATVTKKISQAAVFVDKHVIDAAVNGIAKLAGLAGHLIRAFQTGKIQSYFALSMLLLLMFILYLAI